MNREQLTIRKTPFLFLGWLIIIEFFFALLPFLLVTLLNVRDSYSGPSLSGAASYSVLIAIGMATIQQLLHIRAGNASQPLTVSQAARYIQDHLG